MIRRERPEPVCLVSKSLHAYLDYPLALALIMLPFLLGLMPLATTLAVGGGLLALLLTVMTDHETGVLRVLPYGVHLAVDGLIGAAFLVAPVVFGMHELEAAFFLVFGVAILLVVAAHRPDQTASVA